MLGFQPDWYHPKCPLISVGSNMVAITSVLLGCATASQGWISEQDKGDLPQIITNERSRMNTNNFKKFREFRWFRWFRSS
jgi:hypothetical protein